MPTRLGVVSYLNTRPLVQPLESRLFEHPFDLIYDVPSRCADNLREGKADVSLVPSIEIARGSEPFCIVPGVAIASKGPVQSVLLITQRDPEDIRTLALDESSRTAATLVRIVLEKRFSCRPIASQSAPSLDEMLAANDAALLIGDPALDLDTCSVATFSVPLSAGAVITGVSFEYRYTTGFGPSGAGSNFTLQVAGAAVYSSPQLTDYSYSKSHPNYSAPVPVTVNNLVLHAAADTRVSFAFDNNDRNVQLLLPLQRWLRG